jgi:transporter family protein
MWLLLAVVSSLCLGFYDIFKKISLTGNNVLSVLFLNTLFGALFLSPIVVAGIVSGDFGFGGVASNHLYILLKSFIVLTSWILGYFGMKHLPITITGPVNATRPVLVLVGAIVVFGEQLNLLQWLGIALGFTSLFFISRIGSREGFSLRSSRWLWFCLGAAFFGAVSALYDKYLLRHFHPLQVQAWYSLYQCVIMGITVLILSRTHHDSVPFHWRWSIPFIAVFLTVADLAYFYSLSLPDSMISVVSMIRRGSVLVSFLYGVIFLRERHIRLKLIDLAVLLASLTLLVLGSAMK